MPDLDGIYSFINEEFLSQKEEDFWEELYQGLPESPDMDDVVDKENYEKSIDTNDQFFVAEVCLTDERSRKSMARITKSVKENEENPRGVEHPTLFADHSLYEVSFTNVQTEDLTANMISENMISQVDSEGHHYQVLKEISDYSADGSALKRSDVFIRSCG